MKKIITLSLLIVFTMGTSKIYCQSLTKFIKKREDAAEKTVVNRTGKEADKAVTKEVNKALDKIFGKDEAEEMPAEAPETTSVEENNENDSDSEASENESSGSQHRSSGTIKMNALMGAMGVGSGNARIKPMYEYEGYIEMKITTFEEGNKEDAEMIYKTYVDSKSPDYSIEMKEEGNDDLSFIIFDTENQVMLTLADSDGEKTGFAVNFTADQSQAIEGDMDEEEENIDPYEAYKTGKTKKILGYTCDEYVIEDDYSITTMWITDDLEKDTKRTYQKNSTFAGLFTHSNNARGIVMETITEDKDDHDKTVMIVTKIDLNHKHSISTAGYNVISMGAVPDMEEEEEN